MIKDAERAWTKLQEPFTSNLGSPEYGVLWDDEIQIR